MSYKMTVFLLSLISVIVSTSGPQVQVIFTSSPDPPTIAEGDTAVFNCSSNHSAVFINWLFNRTVSASTFTPDGVIVNGVSTPVSSLIMPGLVDPFNDTEVQCVAFGSGIGDFSPSSVILRVQQDVSSATTTTISTSSISSPSTPSDVSLATLISTSSISSPSTPSVTPNFSSATPISTLSISSSTPVTQSPSGESGDGTSTDIIVAVVGGVGGGAVVLLCIIVACAIICKVKTNRTLCGTKNDSNRMAAESPVNSHSPLADLVCTNNEDYLNCCVKISSQHGNPDPTYHQESAQAHYQATAVPPVVSSAYTLTRPQEYSTSESLVNTPSSFAPQSSETKPVIDTKLIKDMPGYTEVPDHIKKSTSSKKKQETKNQNDPLPLAPNDETEATPDSQLATHQYADLDEIRSKKGRPPLPTVINDVEYSQVISSYL